MKQFRQSRTAICSTIALATACLGGCAGVGVVASSDPLVKLNEAEDLFLRQDRPLAAERLILEATEIYRKEGNSRGLGNAHREYADLLRSGAVSGKWQTHYRQNGFSDRSVTYENRLEKAREYYEKSLGFYIDAEKVLSHSGRWDDLTNLYFNMAWTTSQLGQTLKSCAYYDQSLAAYKQNIALNPDAKPYSPSGGLPARIENSKKALGCP